VKYYSAENESCVVTLARNPSAFEFRVDASHHRGMLELLIVVLHGAVDGILANDYASCGTPARTSTRPAKTAIGVTGIRERMPSSTRSSINVWKCFVRKPLVLDRKAGK